MASKTLVPLKQALVPFYGSMILAVLLPDGRIAASLKSLCSMLKLARHGQMERIRNDAALAKELLLVVVQTPGGPQVTEVLTARGIPTWLTGLQPNMVAPEKRPLILALKEEAVDVLYRHFFKIDTDEKTSPPPSQTTEPPRSSRKMTHKAFERLHQVADELDESYMVAQEKIEAMGEHIVALEAKVEALKQEPASQGASKSRQPMPQDGPILTAEHRNQVYALARHLRAQTGEPVAALFAELAETFGVEDMSDIPDAGWEEVAAWFWERRQRD